MKYSVYMETLDGVRHNANYNEFIEALDAIKYATKHVYAIARLFDETGDMIAEMVGHELRRPTYIVVNGNTGNNLTKKNYRDAATNSAMRWRQTLRALDIPVYVMNSLTGEIVYEAL